jgi:hypothetical protein
MLIAVSTAFSLTESCGEACVQEVVKEFKPLKKFDAFDRIWYVVPGWVVVEPGLVVPVAGLR